MLELKSKAHMVKISLRETLDGKRNSYSFVGPKHKALYNLKIRQKDKYLFNVQTMGKDLMRPSFG